MTESFTEAKDVFFAVGIGYFIGDHLGGFLVLCLIAWVEHDKRKKAKEAACQK